MRQKEAEPKSDTTSPITTSPFNDKGERDRKPKYAQYQDRPEEAIGLKDFREKAQLKDRPTSADAKKGLKDLPTIISQVGNAASFLQNMYSQMGMASALMSGSSQSSRKTTIEDSLTGALSILANKWTYDVVIDVFDAALEGEKFNDIDVVYQDLVKNALAKLYASALEYGANNIPVNTYTIVDDLGVAPEEKYIVEEAPDFYLQQYYNQNEDPYPGYILWYSQESDDLVYTRRKIGDRYYTSPQEEVFSISEQELAENLDPYIEEANLTAAILNDLLSEQETNVENNTEEKTLGKGASGPNAAAIAAKLLGYMSTINNLQKSLQLPVSVLSQGKINDTLKGFEKQMSKLKTLKGMLQKAAIPPQAASAMGALGGLAGGNITGALSGVAGNAIGSAVSSVAGSTVGNIAANYATTKIPSILKQ